MQLLKDAMILAAQLANRHVSERFSAEQNAQIMRLVVDAIFDMYVQAISTGHVGFSAEFRAPHEARLLAALVDHGLVKEV